MYLRLDVASAVARMAAWAQVQDHPKLVMDPQEWQRLVLKHLPDIDNQGFVDEVLKKPDREEMFDMLNTMLCLAMLCLAMNIWTNTLQPNRGGKSAKEMMELRYGRMDESNGGFLDD